MNYLDVIIKLVNGEITKAIPEYWNNDRWGDNIFRDIDSIYKYIFYDKSSNRIKVKTYSGNIIDFIPVKINIIDKYNKDTKWVNASDYTEDDFKKYKNSYLVSTMTNEEFIKTRDINKGIK